MKRNLILSIIACGASLALCPCLRAQDATPVTSGSEAGGHQWGHHGGGGGMSIERLTKELDLTADQQTKIKPILDTEHTQMQSLRSDTSLSREDRMAKAKDAHDTANTAINAVLTPDQQTKFAAMQEKMHNHHHGGAGGDTQPTASPTATP